MSGESGEHRRLERFNFDSESYSLPRGNDVAFVIIVVMLVAARYRETLLRSVVEDDNPFRTGFITDS